jgi:hypothetical protein
MAQKKYQKEKQWSTKHQNDLATRKMGMNICAPEE